MAKRKSGPKPKVIDVQQLKGIAALHPTKEETAAFFNVSLSTLDRRLKEKEYDEAYKKGWALGKLSLRRKQHEVAQAGNVTMLIWLGKQELEQSDKRDITHAGDPEKPIITISDAELKRIARDGDSDD